MNTPIDKARASETPRTDAACEQRSQMGDPFLPTPLNPPPDPVVVLCEQLERELSDSRKWQGVMQEIADRNQRRVAELEAKYALSSDGEHEKPLRSAVRRLCERVRQGVPVDELDPDFIVVEALIGASPRKDADPMKASLGACSACPLPDVCGVNGLCAYRPCKAESALPEGTLDLSLEARLKDAEDDVLRLHGEKMKFFERVIELEREVERWKGIYASACSKVVGLGVKAFGTLDEGLDKLTPSAIAPVQDDCFLARQCMEGRTGMDFLEGFTKFRETVAARSSVARSEGSKT